MDDVHGGVDLQIYHVVILEQVDGVKFGLNPILIWLWTRLEVFTLVWDLF